MHEAAGVAPQPEQGLTLEEPWQDKTGMFAVEALELCALAAMGQSYPPPAHPADSDINQILASHLETCASLNSPRQERESNGNMD